MPQALWTALHFPALPLDVFSRGQAVDALAVSSGGQRPRVVAMSATAAAGGVREGMALAAAQALLPALIVRNREPAAESAALDRLAAWALQFTPTVSLAPPDLLLLEIGGCGRLFGSLELLLSRIGEGVEALGFSAVIATAPTPRGAELLTRSGRSGRFALMPRMQAALGEVPTALLALAPSAQAALADAGIDTFGGCLDLPRDGLARRFGQALLDDLDRALGRIPEARALFEPPAQYRGRLEFAAPVAEAEALVFAARRLLAEACGWLAGRGLGVLQWQLQGGHRKTPATLWRFKLSAPTHDVDVLTRIAQERLARSTLVDGVEWLALDSVETAPYQARNEHLFGNGTAAPEAAAALLDRLRARLGDEAVQTLAVTADHRPERSSRPGEPHAAPPLPEAPRPLWLLPAPEAIRERGWEVLDGPERVESGWWDGGDARRDYYVIRLSQGETLWVYRDLRGGGWYRQGIFG